MNINESKLRQIINESVKNVLTDEEYVIEKEKKDNDIFFHFINIKLVMIK